MIFILHSHILRKIAGFISFFNVVLGTIKFFHKCHCMKYDKIFLAKTVTVCLKSTPFFPLQNGVKGVDEQDSKRLKNDDRQEILASFHARLIFLYILLLLKIVYSLFKNKSINGISPIVPFLYYGCHYLCHVS